MDIIWLPPKIEEKIVEKPVYPLKGEIPIGVIVADTGYMETEKPTVDIAIEEVNNYVGALGLPITFKAYIENAEGSAIAGIAGSLWSFYCGTVLAAAYTRTYWTFWPWLMAMIGGMGNNIGALVGVATVIIFRRLIIYYKYSLEAYIPFSVVWLEQILLALALILVMMFRPQGIIPEKPAKTKIKKTPQQ